MAASPKTSQELLDELQNDDDVKGVALDWYESIKRDRAEIDWRFYVNEMYYEGEHYAKRDVNTGVISTPPARRGEMRAVVPFAKTIVDANVAELLKDDPVWNVLPQPNPKGEVGELELKKASWHDDLLDYYHNKLEIGVEDEVVVRSGVMHAVGWRYLNYNPDKERFDGQGKGEIESEPVSITDLYLPIHSRSVKDAPVVIRTVRKDLEQIRNSALYKDKKHLWEAELVADDAVSDNDQELAARQMTLGGETPEGNQRGTVLLLECYVKYYPKNSTKAKYRLVTVSAKQRLLLRNEETDLERPPFFLYRTRRKVDQIYAQGVMGDLIPINRALDNLESRKLEYNFKFTKGQMVGDRGGNFNRVTNENGDLILKNRGHQLDVIGLPPIPPSTSEQINRLQQYGYDVGGVHEVSLGRVPKGVESARALENLLYGDAQAKRVAKKNYENYLKEVAQHILWLISKYFPRKRLVQFYNREGQLQRFSVVGSQTDNPRKEELAAYEDTLMVKPDNDVNVVIGSGLGNTVEGRQQKAMELYKMSLFTRKNVLKQMQLGGNVEDESKEAWQEAVQAEQVSNAPPKPTLRDFLTIKLPDLSPNERGQILQRHFGIQPEESLEQIPGSLSNQLEIQEAMVQAEGEKTNQKLAADLTRQDDATLQEIDKQEALSVNPAIPGGALDLTGGEEGEESGETSEAPLY